MISMTTNIPEIEDRLKRMQVLVDSGWQEDVREMMNIGLKTVKQLTPRSKGRSAKGKRHFRTGWQLKIIGGKAKGRIPMLAMIYHDRTHKFTVDAANRGVVEIMPSAFMTVKGAKQNYTLLDILEYGSKRHEIVPWKKKVLRWLSGGKPVFSKHVDHPGTKPYAMVRKTKVKLTQMWEDILRKLNRRIMNEWR